MCTDTSTRPRAPSIRWGRPCKSSGKEFGGKKLTSCRDDKKLAELSSLGHFLKGSSATLGLNKVKEACEKIQHYGAGKDETGTVAEPDESASLKNIEATLKEAKEDYSEVEGFLRKFYGEAY